MWLVWRDSFGDHNAYTWCESFFLYAKHALLAFLITSVFRGWRDHYDIVSPENDGTYRFRFKGVADVFGILEYEVNMLVESLEGPSERFTAADLYEDCFSEASL